MKIGKNFWRFWKKIGKNTGKIHKKMVVELEEFLHKILGKVRRE